MQLPHRSFQLYVCQRTLPQRFQLKSLVRTNMCAIYIRSLPKSTQWQRKEKHIYGFTSVLSDRCHCGAFICSAVDIAVGRFDHLLRPKSEILNYFLNIWHSRGWCSFASLINRDSSGRSAMKKRKYLTNRKFELAQNKQAKLYPNCDVSVWMRSCEKEITMPISGKVRGAIPAWLNGSLLRNGPGSMKISDMHFEHLFDSLALLHKYFFQIRLHLNRSSPSTTLVCIRNRFEISSGKVTYQCRFIRSDSYEKNVAANRIVMNSYGTSVVPDPCHTIFQRISSIFTEDSGTDNANISIYPMGDEFYAFTECPIIQRWVRFINFDAAWPSSIAKQNKSWNAGINGQAGCEQICGCRQSYVAPVHHARWNGKHWDTFDWHLTSLTDPNLVNNQVYNLGMSIANNTPAYNVICFPNGPNKFNNAHVVASIPARWSFHPSYMHTFGLTENFFIIIEQPLSISVLESFKAKVLRKPLASTLKWFQDEYTLIHAICRLSGRRKFTFKASAFFFLHVINAFETRDHIILDICCYRDPSVLDCMYVDAMENMQQISNYANMFKSRPLRFVLPINVPCDESTEDVPMPPSWNYCDWMKCLSTATSVRKPHNHTNNINRVFDDESATIQAKREVTCGSENLVTLKNSAAKAYRMPSQRGHINPVIYCVPEILCDVGCETPRINEKMSQGKYGRRIRWKCSGFIMVVPFQRKCIDIFTRSVPMWTPWIPAR